MYLMVLFIYQALPFWNIRNEKLVITTGFVETRTVGGHGCDGGGRISNTFFTDSGYLGAAPL
jgi:hypothetical protein